MARAKVHHVKKARKSNKNLGIKKGQEYWWWAFRYGGKNVSTTNPGVEYMERLTEHQQNIRDFENRKDTLEEVSNWQDAEQWNDEKTDLEGEISNWLDELNSRKDNLPEQFQDSHVLNEQIEELESLQSEVESLDEPEFDSGELDEEETDEEE